MLGLDFSGRTLQFCHFVLSTLHLVHDFVSLVGDCIDAFHGKLCLGLGFLIAFLLFFFLLQSLPLGLSGGCLLFCLLFGGGFGLLLLLAILGACSCRASLEPGSGLHTAN